MFIRILRTQIIKNMSIKMSRHIVSRSFVKNLCQKMPKWNKYVWRQHISDSSMCLLMQYGNICQSLYFDM